MMPQSQLLSHRLTYGIILYALHVHAYKNNTTITFTCTNASIRYLMERHQPLLVT